MVMRCCDNFPSQRMILGNIDMVIVIDQTVIYLHSSIVVEGCRDVLVPLVVVERGLLDFGVNFLNCQHDHCPEVFWFEDDNLIIVLLPLFVICSSTKQVSFLVRCSWFVVEREVVFCQFCHPACLVVVQFLGFSEVLEILVICPDFEILSRSH